MIIRIEDVKYTKGGLEAWVVVKYFLFGFLPIYISKSRVR